MTVLGVIGVIFALLVLSFVGFAFWLRRKVRNGLAWLLVQTLDQALQSMKKKQAEPDHQPDAELDSLVEEAEKALPLAQKALEHGNLKAVADITGPILKKIGDRADKVFADQQAKEAQAREAQVNQAPAPLALEAPTDKTNVDGAQLKTDETKGDDKPAQ